MKHEQVVVDYWVMLKTAVFCLLLTLMGFIFLRLIQMIFWLPGYIQKNQERLEKVMEQSSSDANSGKLNADTPTKESANEGVLKKLK